MKLFKDNYLVISFIMLKYMKLFKLMTIYSFCENMYSMVNEVYYHVKVYKIILVF